MENEEQKVKQDNVTEKVITTESFSGTGGNYLNNPAVGETLTFVIDKVVQSEKTEAVNKEGKSFKIGLVSKNPNIPTKRIDIHTSDGVYTINSWEIYFKLLDGRKESLGALIKWGNDNNILDFKGAKVSIKRLYNGSFINKEITPRMIAAEMGITEDAALEYKEAVRKAREENRLYEVKVE